MNDNVCSFMELRYGLIHTIRIISTLHEFRNIRNSIIHNINRIIFWNKS